MNALISNSTTTKVDISQLIRAWVFTSQPLVLSTIRDCGTLKTINRIVVNVIEINNFTDRYNLSWSSS